MKWMYGITTCGKRCHSPMFEMTSLSLYRGGFECPEHFVDPRNLNLGAFGNWVHAAWSLYLSDPFADRYAIFQDDIACGRNLREYLEATATQPSAYWNLCLWPNNVQECTGWYPAPDPAGLGAQALVFDNDGMRALLQSRWLVDHPRDKFRGRRAIDGIVKTIMGEAGFIELVHSPSLVKHLGAACSTLQTNHYPETANFAGDAVNLMTLIKPPATEAPANEVPSAEPPQAANAGPRVRCFQRLGNGKKRVGVWVITAQDGIFFHGDVDEVLPATYTAEQLAAAGNFAIEIHPEVALDRLASWPEGFSHLVELYLKLGVPFDLTKYVLDQPGK